MESEGGGIVAAAAPIAPTLSSQQSTLRDSFNVTDLANGLNSVAAIVNNPTTPQPVSNLTLGAVLNGTKKPSSPNKVVVRNLLEILRNDETITSGGSPNSSKNSWKSFKEKLTRKKSQNSSTSGRWTSSMPVPQSDVLPTSRSGRDLMLNNRNSLRNSLRNNSLRRVDGVPADDMSMLEVNSGGSPRSGGSFRLSATLAAEREETRRRLSRELDEDGIENDASKESGQKEGEEGEEDEDEDEEDEDDEGGLNFGAPANQPVRMSLMDLLEETDRQAGIDGPTYRLDDEEEEEEEDEEEEDEEEEAGEEELGKGEFSCCVCQVRHKGSAFIPCGHTFCRMCSRELFVQKGNCPLCNNFILEILDIF